jgi:N-acetylmuramoyl-L-alanine amidase
MKSPAKWLSTALFCLAATAAPAQVAVTSVRHWPLVDTTRIAVETSGTFTYRWDRLSEPSRVFYDIRGAKFQLIAKGIYTVPINDARVKQVRVAETQPSVTRVVVDLEDGDFDISSSQLSQPDRLVIEIRFRGSPPETSVSTPTIKSTLKQTPNPHSPEKTPEPPVLAAKAVPPAPASIATPAISTPPPAITAVEPRPAPAAAASPANAAARPARRNSNGDRSLTRTLGLKIRRVVLDPGHGGNDHGSTGPGGLAEKEVVLDVAKRLGAMIQEGLGSEVVYTRAEDAYVPLEQRTQIANTNKADLFLSIHANSSTIRSVAGAETYYLSLTTSKAALDLAARENAASERSVHELKELLQKIALRDKVDESRELAAKLQSSLTQLTAANVTSKSVRRDRGVKKAPFVVLIGASMPSVLAEIGFLSNTREEQMLRKPEYRQKMAEALYKGISQYAESLSRFQVAQSKREPGE